MRRIEFTMIKIKKVPVMKMKFVYLFLAVFSLTAFAQKKSKKAATPKEIAGYERQVLDIKIEGIKDKALYFASKAKGKKPFIGLLTWRWR